MGQPKAVCGRGRFVCTAVQHRYKSVMKQSARILLALLVAVIVGGGYMAFDTWRGAQWVVSPQQISEAQARGEAGYASRPGTVTVRPIRSETADALPFKWAVTGLVCGFIAYRALGRRKSA